MATKRVRFNVYLTPEVAGKLEAIANDLGITKNAVAGLAVQAGIESIRLATDPRWKETIEEMIRTGKPIKMGGYTVGSEEQ